jgi:predicted SAM-dependent methyltransferase
VKTLNLGCGTEKIEGAINVDVSEKATPDLQFDITTQFPLEDEVFDEVYFFHCIEHIEKYKQIFVLAEIHRVMKLGGTLYISYPEFEEVLKCWLENRDGNRKFWEATIYGRQLYPGDYHFAGMQTLQLRQMFDDVGFKVEQQFPEPNQTYNTVLVAKRLPPTVTYEELLYRDVFEKEKVT